MARSFLSLGLIVALALGACSAEAESAPAEPVRLRVGIVGEPRTTNPWEAASLTDAPTRYIQPDPATLYSFMGPTYTLVPFLAAGEAPGAVRDGDVWTVEVSLNPAARWSDGLLVTARDVAFTFETARRLDLGGGYASMWPEPGEGTGVVDVEAVDPATVRIVFDGRPDPAVWPFGVGTAAVFPAHYWEPRLDGVDDAEALYALSGAGAPTATGWVSAGEEAGMWRLDADDGYWRRETRVVVYESGAVEQVRGDDPAVVAGGVPEGTIVAEMVEGPHVDGVDIRRYPDGSAAADALVSGDVDLVLAERGIPRSEYRRLLADPEITVAVNPRLGFRYLGFDATAFPTSAVAFRRALACRIDAAALTVDVLGGSVEAMGSLVPAGLPGWHDPSLAPECAGLTERERVEKAVEILSSAGWTWSVAPAWDDTNRDVDPAGAGLTGPDGIPVPPLTLLAPGWRVDPARATFAAHLAEAARQLGVPVEVVSLGLDSLADRLERGPGSGAVMWVGGWEIPPVPDHVFRLFSPGPADFTGYRSPELTEAAAEFAAASTVADATAAVRKAERILARDVPYVPLFTETIIEARRATVEVPFISVVDGIQRLDGALTFVMTDE